MGWRLFGACSGLGAAAAVVWQGGLHGLLGLAAGALCSIFVLWGWMLVSAQMARTAAQKGTKGAWILTILVFLVKAPAYMAVAVLVQRLGGPGPVSFLMGVAWVYSVAVIWAVARAKRPDA
jgi:hypothetical protein